MGIFRKRKRYRVKTDLNSNSQRKRRNNNNNKLRLNEEAYVKPKKTNKKREAKEDDDDGASISSSQKVDGFDIKDMSPKTSTSKKNDQPQAVKDGILPAHPFRSYIVGASGSGKTNLLLNLLTRENMYKDFFDEIVVISPTALHMDPSYKALNISSKNFFPCKEGVLERLMQIQKASIEDEGKGNEPKVLVIFDDFICFKKFAHSDILLQFAVMSRHWNFSLMLLSQAYHRVIKSIRLQMTNVMYFKGSNKEVEVLADDFGAPGMSKKEFIAKIKEATDEQFSFFFVDLNRSIKDGRYRKNLTTQIIFPNSSKSESHRGDNNHVGDLQPQIPSLGREKAGGRYSRETENDGQYLQVSESSTRA